MRTLVLELRPAELSEAPLHELLEGLATALESRKSLQVTVDVDPVEFDSGTRLAFYRVAQEALGNIAKHAQASTVKLSLTNGADVQLRIQDDGHGFDTSAVPPGHLGLIIMRRARRRRGREARHQLIARPWHRRPDDGLRGMTVAENIRVVVVDDHDLLREGVTACLSGFENLEVVGEASSGEAAIVEVRKLVPDVVVVDLVMPGMGGVEVIRRLRAEHPTIGLLALSSFTERERIREVIQAGANGYLVKSVDADSLAEAVRSAATGRGAFSAEVTQILALGTDRPTSALETLTPREAEIAELLAKGRSNAEIAQALELSLFTVKNHVSNILMKLHVRSRTEATAFILNPD